MSSTPNFMEQIDGTNVCTSFLQTVDQRSDEIAVRVKGQDGQWVEHTYRDLADQTARVAAGLRSLGVGPGDRVVVMVTNRPEFHPIDLAALFLGATPVSIYNSSAPEQVEYMVNHCGGKVAIIEDAFVPRFASVADRLPTLKNIVVLDGDAGNGAGTIAVSNYAELSSQAPLDLAAEALTSGLDDLATIIYTSGTTGNPKGVMLTHRNVCWSLKALSYSMTTQTDLETLAGLRHLSYLPMAHIFERLVGHYYMAFLGVEVSCCPNPAELAAMVGEVRPNLLIGVPRVWEKFHAGAQALMAANPESAAEFTAAYNAARAIQEKVDAGTATDEEAAQLAAIDEKAFAPVRALFGLDETRICVSGAAPLRGDVLEWFNTIGVPLSEGYGLSETMALGTWAQKAKPGAVGVEVPGVDVEIADDGEVMLRGGNIFPGYLDDADKTAEVLEADGWFHTGDIGEIDEDGYLRIVDRKKELIITAGGKNVSPANLESALKSIPLVGQAAAIGDGRAFVSALVVLDPDAARVYAAQKGLSGDAASLSALAQNPDVIAAIEGALPDAMASFNNAEAVKKVKILGEEWLPDSDLLTPTSKLKRRGINARFAAEIDSIYN